MKSAWSWLCFVADLLIPRFVTEDVALSHVRPGSDWGAYDIVCCMADVEPGEWFDGVATVDAFQWLGIGVTIRIGNFRRWPM